MPLHRSVSINGLPLAAAALLTTALYTFGLDRAPIYLDGDEAHFGTQALSIARTGRDLAGHRTPLFVNLWDPLGDPKPHEQNADRQRIWYQPMLFYLIALVLELRPLTEASIRFPTAIIGGLVNPVLIYLVGRRLFRRRSIAVVAALILVASPAHFVLAREALDYVCPLPFVLGWLLCLTAYLDGDSDWLPLAGGLLLGVGFFSFIASWIVMPLCLALSWIAFAMSGRDPARACWRATAGFMLPFTVAAPWIALHPQVLRDILERYLTGGNSVAFGLDTVRGKVGEAWDYLDPVYLFLTGGVSMTTSTGRAGVLPLAAGALVPLGVYELLKRGPSRAMRAVLLIGFLVPAVPATLFGGRFMVQRELVVVPFAAIIATFGVVLLERQPTAAARWLAVALVVLVPAQFAFVYRDYFTEYKRRSAFWYDPVAFRDVALAVVDTDALNSVPVLYLSRALDDAGPKWRFYATKYQRTDLLHRTRYFDEPAEIADAPAGALAVMYSDASARELLAAGRWSVARTIVAVDGRAASTVLRKVHE